MSRAVNRVTLVGNLGADPDVRATSNGSRVATLSLATSKTWTNDKGEKQEKTAWHRVICWNAAKGPQLADLVEQWCQKGSKLFVEGEIEYRSWQDKDGTMRYTTEINAREIVFLGGTKEKVDAPAKKPRDFDEAPEALDAEDDTLPW